MAESSQPRSTTDRRRAVESTLDRVVRDNRLTLAVTVPAVGAVLLVAAARGVVPTWLALHPVLLVVAVGAMRLPPIAGVVPTIDRRAAGGLLLLSAFAYAVEFVGVTTGFPYGTFSYTAALGPMLGGVVPLALPLLYVPLVVDSYLLGIALLGRRVTGGTARVTAGVVTLLAVDLVLDPGAVAVGFWAYDPAGAYYGVPASNFVGWLLTGSVAVLVVDWAFEPSTLEARLSEAPYVLDDLVSFLVLWGGINLAAGHWVAVLVAACLAITVDKATGLLDRLAIVADGRWVSR